MRQILLLILLFVVGQWFVKALRRAQPPSSTRPDPQTGRAANDSAGTNARGAAGKGAAASLPEPMVRCAECGVHAPRSESINHAGHSFCSDEHARRYAARAAGSDQGRAAR